MPIVRTEALVVKTVRFRETSLIARLLTRDHGVVPVIAKGARRPRSRLAAVGEIFQRLDVTYYAKEGREIQTLSAVERLDSPDPTAGSLERMEAAGRWLRFLRAVVPDGAPARPIYELATIGLDRLGRTPIAALGRWETYHRLRVATALGHGPVVAACAVCGREVPDGGRLAFSIEDGGVVCGACGGGRPAAERIDADAYARLTLYDHPDWGLLASADGDAPAEVGIRRLLDRFVGFHVGVGLE